MIENVCCLVLSRLIMYIPLLRSRLREFDVLWVRGASKMVVVGIMQFSLYSSPIPLVFAG